MFTEDGQERRQRAVVVGLITDSAGGLCSATC